ncbi:MAG: ERCC4 domain-containing protein [Candidatus Paceibacterota bacterium]
MYLLTNLMKIVLDCRENDLIELCSKKLENSTFKNIIMNSEQLPIGDIIIKDDDDNELIIIERKSLKDLAASINDGRYEEQSFRLNNCSVHNHNIIYLIEGEWSDYSKYKHKCRITEQTLLSSIISINHFKGFSLYRTSNTSETAAYVLHLADKLEREKNKKKPYYSNCEQTSTSSNNTVEKYCEVTKRVKKDNITVQNIGEILLSQIPNVSSQSAIAIMGKFKTIKNLIEHLENDNNCLNDITTGKTGKLRRLNKNCIANVFIFLLQKENEIIIS